MANSSPWLLIGCLYRLFHSLRSSIPLNYSAKERCRQVLAEDSKQVCLRCDRCFNFDGINANIGNRYSAIKQDEKNQIKRRAIEAGVVEPASQLALQNALIVAKILRAEFPLEW